jgi:hypothetical protein
MVSKDKRIIKFSIEFLLFAYHINSLLCSILDLSSFLGANSMARKVSSFMSVFVRFYPMDKMRFLFIKMGFFLVFWWLLFRRITVAIFSIFILGDISHLAMDKWHPKG